MNRLETLCDIIERQGTLIVSTRLRSRNIAISAHENDGDIIALNENLCREPAEVTSALLHEDGHCATGAFFGAAASRFTRLRCEYKADRYVARERITVEMVDIAHKDKGLDEVWEFAEYFGVTEEYMGRVLYIHNRTRI
jgi:hypothetical protein